eukprot:663374-Pleurochrysis_carterae.AAC.4
MSSSFVSLKPTAASQLRPLLLMSQHLSACPNHYQAWDCCGGATAIAIGYLHQKAAAARMQSLPWFVIIGNTFFMYGADTS